MSKENKHWSVKIATWALMGAMGFMTQATQASLIAYDGFDYDLGPISGRSGGTGWASTWYMSTAGDSDVVNRSLSYTSGNVSMNNSASGKALSTPQVTSDFAVQRSFPNTTSGDIFISFLYQTNTPDDINSWWNQIYAWQTSYNANAPSVVMAADGGILGRRDGGQGAVMNPAVDTRDDAVYLVVLQLDWDGSAYSHLRVYVNPDSTENPSGSYREIALTATSRTDTWNLLGLRLNSSVGNTASDVYFGEMRVGSTWDAVVIPEPGTLLLLGAGGSLLLLRRRVLRK